MDQCPLQCILVLTLVPAAEASPRSPRSGPSPPPRRAPQPVHIPGNSRKTQARRTADRRTRQRRLDRAARLGVLGVVASLQQHLRGQQPRCGGRFARAVKVQDLNRRVHADRRRRWAAPEDPSSSRDVRDARDATYPPKQKPTQPTLLTGGLTAPDRRRKRTTRLARSAWIAPGSLTALTLLIVPGHLGLGLGCLPRGGPARAAEEVRQHHEVRARPSRGDLGDLVSQIARMRPPLKPWMSYEATTAAVAVAGPTTLHGIEPSCWTDPCPLYMYM